MARERRSAQDICSGCAEETEALGAALGARLASGDVVCLSGDLGAGKTVFSRGVGAGFGATQAPTSPTYNLVHEHRRVSDGTLLYHIDLYRVSGAADAATLSLDDIFEGAGIVIIEWPERIRALLPAERLWIDFDTVAETERRLRVSAVGERHARLVAALAAMASETRR